MMMAPNDDNKCKYNEEAESAVTAKKWRLGNDSGDDSSSNELLEETTEAKMEAKEVSSEEESMNQTDSSVALTTTTPLR
jgi:hypothetical protein